MTPKELAIQAVNRLKERYPDALCSLEYDPAHPYRLLFATRLSAQCTDARVNQVTPALFRRFPTLEAMAQADLQEVEELVRPCGFYHLKAADLIAMSKMLLERWDGQLPDTMEELTSLPGVGRKTANLILGDIFHQPSYVTDTHCIRICSRIGITDGSRDPLQVEKQLRKVLPPEESGNFCHRLVLFGRDCCSARKPDCGNCPLADICQFIK